MRGITSRSKCSFRVLSCSLLCCGCLIAATGRAQESYSFVRTVDGYADLVEGESNSGVELVANYPILVGDRLRVSQHSRVETLLPDGSVVRAAGDTEIKFERIALSGDTHDATTRLQLIQGKIQAALAGAPMGREAFRIDTVNASVFLQKRGSYKIFSDGSSWTEIEVRDGSAEVLTELDRSVIGSNTKLTVDGARQPHVWTEEAGEKDALEIWGETLVAEASGAETPQVEPALSYAAAPLYRHGGWVQVDGRNAWRPYARSSWRPYHAGWWVHTPSGLTWVSTEPWGWVTYHYGVWDHSDRYGWIWYPGHAYSPAAVYWYWGPTYIGWIPAGYYGRHFGARNSAAYRNRHRYTYNLFYPRPGYGMYLGAHWAANGHVSNWSHWTFTRHEHFGHRSGHKHLHSAVDLHRRGAIQAEVPYAKIETDTRRISPRLWDHPDRIMRSLETAPGPSASGSSKRAWEPDLWRRHVRATPSTGSLSSSRLQRPGTRRSPGSTRLRDVSSHRLGRERPTIVRPGTSSIRSPSAGIRRSPTTARPSPPGSRSGGSRSPVSGASGSGTGVSRQGAARSSRGGVSGSRDH